MTNPFDWGYLTTVPKGLMAYGPLAIAYIALFGGGLVALLLANRLLLRRLRDHALHRRLVERATQISSWILGIGLTFFAFRALELPLLGMRLWLYLCALSVLVALGLAVWYWRMRYPAERERYEYEQERRRYLQPTSGARRRRRGRVTT